MARHSKRTRPFNNKPLSNGTAVQGPGERPNLARGRRAPSQRGQAEQINFTYSYPLIITIQVTSAGERWNDPREIEG